MINRFLILLLILLLFYITQVGRIQAQPLIEKTTSTWKSFEKLNFNIAEKEAWLVSPKTSLPGKPWIWRARFPGWHTEADSILVSRGFHLAYINTNDYFGSPASMDIWDKFYSHLTSVHQLNDKVALMGVSRGGLFIYNWANRNPENVLCIYAEAPVCDFTSWPGGFGKGDGSQKDWVKLKEMYGFESDEVAKNYKDIPIYNVKSLAAYKIPILHMIGLNDGVVPPDENTMVLVNNYISAGGIATVVPCTEGEQTLNGHHFPIETPETVAEFVTYHYQKRVYESSPYYHDHRAGLFNSYHAFEKNRKGTVAFLGGSITYNPGWRDSIINYLHERFPDTDFRFVNAGIPSMGTTPAAFRLERDVLSKGKFDLIFEEAAVNDASNGRTDMEQRRAMEGVVRHLRISNPYIDIVMMHFVDPDKISSYNIGTEPSVIKNHNLIAEHYSIPTINLAQEVTERINRSEFTWEDDFIDLHPSPFGQGIYARSMIQFLKDEFDLSETSTNSPTKHHMPPLLDSFSYYNGKLIDISEATHGKDWKVDKNWIPGDGTGTRENYRNVPMLISDHPGESVKLTFTGRAVGIAVASGQDAGIVEFRIDGGDWMNQDLYTRWSKSLHLPWYFTLASELSDEIHVLEIKVSKDKNKLSNGRACRIRYFYSN